MAVNNRVKDLVDVAAEAKSDALIEIGTAEYAAAIFDCSLAGGVNSPLRRPIGKW